MRTTVLMLAIATMLGSSGVDAQAKGLLCGGGWHYSFYYFKCVRNRHHCPAGKHWISLLKTCV